MRLNVNCKRWQKLLLISFYSVFVYNYHVRVFEKFAREVDLREGESESESEQHENINRIVCIMAKSNSGDNSSSISS